MQGQWTYSYTEDMFNVGSMDIQLLKTWLMQGQWTFTHLAILIINFYLLISFDVYYYGNCSLIGGDTGASPSGVVRCKWDLWFHELALGKDNSDQYLYFNFH